jgi:hypothetical protein
MKKEATDNPSGQIEVGKEDSPNREVKRTAPPKYCLPLLPYARRPDLLPISLPRSQSTERNVQWISTVFE